jgi:hypothetical protein
MSSYVDPLDAPSRGRSVRAAWSQYPGSALRGLSVARESGAALVWDAAGIVYLLNRVGELQARAKAAGALTAACISDDGTTVAAVGEHGEIWRLKPDLQPHSGIRIGRRATACALDPFGLNLAVADGNGELHVFNAAERRICGAQTPRPLQHLAFIPEQPLLIGCADFGFVGCFGLTGKCAWRDAFVSHISGVATNGDGSRILVACYSDGLRRYDFKGRSLETTRFDSPCRLTTQSYDGRRALVCDLGSRVRILDQDGVMRTSWELDAVPVGLAIGALGENYWAAFGDGRITSAQLTGLKS